MKVLVVLLGPTGVGKTSLSLRIAEHLNTPIINADSRQLFAEIPIGTAAPTAKQMQRVRHYFVGNHHLTDYYNAAMYESEVLSLIAKLHETHDTCLMCGGSMMYIDAVCKGIDDIPTVDEGTRTWMKQRLETEGLPTLLEELRRLDPEHYAIVDHHNPRRVVHALEICHMTGRTYTSFRKQTTKQRPFKIIKIGLELPREQLYERINNRVLQMIDDGLVEEARKVYGMRHLNSLQTVGYRELFEYFDGVIPLEEAIRRIQSNTRQYMRKQLTWFHRDTSISWFLPHEYDTIINHINTNLQVIENQ